MGFENIKVIKRLHAKQAYPHRFRSRVLLIVSDAPMALTKTNLMRHVSPCGLTGKERGAVLDSMVNNGEVKRLKSEEIVNGRWRREVYYLTDTQLKNYQLNLSMRKIEAANKPSKLFIRKVDKFTPDELKKFKQGLLNKLRYINQRLQNEQSEA